MRQRSDHTSLVQRRNPKGHSLARLSGSVGGLSHKVHLLERGPAGIFHAHQRPLSNDEERPEK
jgi:hypothetical protein